MVQFMKEAPSCFEGPKEGVVTALGGYSYEDWHRAYKILSVFWRMSSDARQSTVDESKRKAQTRPAIPLSFSVMRTLQALLRIHKLILPPSSGGKFALAHSTTIWVRGQSHATMSLRLFIKRLERLKVTDSHHFD